MAGETTTHNLISQNLLFNIRPRLKGSTCRIYMSDIRVNFQFRDDEYYYYPDVVGTCDKRDTHARFVRYPKIIVEVLSESTERVDRREKFFAYTTIESLEEYALVSQAAREVTVIRRANGWKAETIIGDTASVRLESLNVSVLLANLYEGL
jgi:Uma2 family endonuclease